MVYQDEFIGNLVKKYNITLSTGNDILKNFVLDFNNKLKNSDYPEIPDTINVIKCFADKCIPGRKGTCISERNYCYILLYAGFFQEMARACPKSKKEIVKSYIMGILHELAHYLIDLKFNFDESIDGHGQEWIDCCRFLGVEEKYLYPYL